MPASVMLPAPDPTMIARAYVERELGRGVLLDVVAAPTGERELVVSVLGPDETARVALSPEQSQELLMDLIGLNGYVWGALDRSPVKRPRRKAAAVKAEAERTA